MFPLEIVAGGGEDVSGHVYVLRGLDVLEVGSVHLENAVPGRVAAHVGRLEGFIDELEHSRKTHVSFQNRGLDDRAVCVI